MTEKTATQEQLKTLVRTMPKWKDLIVEEFKADSEFARLAIADELEEYAETGEIKYLLATLKDAARAKGFVNLSRETGLNRTTLYDVFNGSNPRVGTLNKILQALGFRMVFVAVDHTKPVTQAARKRAVAVKAKKQDKRLQHA
jgi:Predicted transcriptional regulator